MGPFPQQRRVPSPCSACVPLTWAVTHGGCHLKPRTISGRLGPREPPTPAVPGPMQGSGGRAGRRQSPAPTARTGHGTAASGPSRCPAGPDLRPGSGGLTRGGGHAPLSGGLQHLSLHRFAAAVNSVRGPPACGCNFQTL